MVEIRTLNQNKSHTLTESFGFALADIADIHFMLPSVGYLELLLSSHLTNIGILSLSALLISSYSNLKMLLQMDSWLGNRKRILVLNREDMISTADRNAWATYLAKQGIKVVFSNGQLGMVHRTPFSFVQFMDRYIMFIMIHFVLFPNCRAQ